MGVGGDQVDAPELLALGDCDDGLDRIALAISLTTRWGGGYKNTYRGHGLGLVGEMGDTKMAQ